MRHFFRMDERLHPFRSRKTRAWFCGVRSRRIFKWYEENDPGFLAVAYAEAIVSSAKW